MCQVFNIMWKSSLINYRELNWFHHAKDEVFVNLWTWTGFEKLHIWDMLIWKSCQHATVKSPKILPGYWTKFLCRIEDLARSYRFLLGVGSCKGIEEDDMFERIFNQSLQSIFVKNHNSQHFPMGATYFMKHFLQKKQRKIN